MLGTEIDIRDAEGCSCRPGEPGEVVARSITPFGGYLGNPEATPAAMLRAAAELYAAYGIVFVDDEERSRRLTRRSLKYARQAMCAVNADTCSQLFFHSRLLV